MIVGEGRGGCYRQEVCCARLCMHFIYPCTLLCGTQGPHLGGLGLCAPRSLPGQMAPVTERGGGAMEGKGGKDGALSCP